VARVTPEAFLRRALENPANVALLQRLPALEIPQCYLVAGCLFQATWNATSGREASADVSDYDVFYYDARDLSWEAEDAVVRQVRELASDLNVVVDVKNQARVHLWYEQRFGHPCPPLHSSQDGIDRYLVRCTCVGVEVQSGELYAPDGLNDLVAGRLLLNPKNPIRPLFRAKAESYRARWPWLQVVEEGS
jgi:uncharacterized protein